MKISTTVTTSSGQPALWPCLSLLLLAFSPSSSEAGGELDETRSVQREGEVRIENVAGHVELRTWDRAEVHVSGRLGQGVEGLSFETEGSLTDIEVLPPSRGGGSFGASDLVVTIPRGSRLEIVTVSAGIDVQGSSARAALSTVSGSVVVISSPKQLSVETVSGRIHVSGASKLLDVALRTISGEVHFEGALAKRGSLEVETLSGAVRLALPAETSARFELSSFSGSLVNHLSADRVAGKGFGPGVHLEFEMGQGKASVAVSTFSASVTLESLTEVNPSRRRH